MGEGVAVEVGSVVGVADGVGLGAAVGTCVGCGVALGCGVLVGIRLSGTVAVAVGACVRMVDIVASGVDTAGATCVSLTLLAQAKLTAIVRARAAEKNRATISLRKMHQSRAVAAAFARLRLEGSRERVARQVFAHRIPQNTLAPAVYDSH